MDDATTTFPFDDQLARQLISQPIVLLGDDLDQAAGNRLCTQLLLLSAEDPALTSACGSTRPVTRCPRCWPYAT